MTIQQDNADHSDRRDLGVRVALLVVSVAVLIVLTVAAMQENVLADWRTHQLQYAGLLRDKATDDWGTKLADEFTVEMRQIVVPALDVADRCVSCHSGTDDPRMVGLPQPYAAHPGPYLKWHDIEKFGCTICHGGQGRATEMADAHGDVKHWGDPLLRGKLAYSSCSKCHFESDLYSAEEDRYARGKTVLAIDGTELGAFVRTSRDPRSLPTVRGKQLVTRLGCLGCHKYRGRGGTLGPDITYVGDKGTHDFDFSHIQGERTVAQWLLEHFKHPAKVSPDTLMPELGLTDRQARDLTDYMLSLHRKTAPAEYTPIPPRAKRQPATGQQLYELFCSGCHGVDGQGSTVREFQAIRSIDAPPELLVPSLNHDDTLAVASDDYLREIIRTGREGTTMIAWGSATDGGLLDEEMDRIVEYIRSWQSPRPDYAMIAASRGDVAAGRASYMQNCASCHGMDGQGGIGNTLNSPSFLEIASDNFLARTIIDGRPNTAMPSWRGFDAQRVSDLIAFLRSWIPLRSDWATTLKLISGKSPAVSAGIGKILYKANCVMCHGLNGMGDLATSLATQEFLSIVGDDYLYETITHGRPDTGMPAWRHLSNEDVASLIRHLRTWQTADSRTLPTTPVVGDWDTGRFLYTGICAACHGNDAEGGTGPQLNNPVFLRTASDAMLREWVRHGKMGTPMQGFIKGGQGMAELREHQIDDIVAYVRSLERRKRVAVAKRPSGRPELGAMWYAVACASCHGTRGEGTSGPSLANPGFLSAASDGFLMASLALGRDGTEMRPVKKGAQSILSLTSDEINDIVAFLRYWETSPPSDRIDNRFVIPWDFEHGRQLYVSNCAGCHGVNGKAELTLPGRLSAWAPELNNQDFLAAATDGFLQATIVRGRSGTAMRSFGHGSQGMVDLSEQDIDDIVAYIRRWSLQRDQPITIPALRKPAKSDNQKSKRVKE